MELDIKDKIKELKNKGFYNDWQKLIFGPITFFTPHSSDLNMDWFKKRFTAYKKNSKILKTKTPKVNFFVYPSKEFGQKIGIIPTVAFIKAREIHGHFNQSPGHELTHILLGEINSTENLPGNGLWHEGISTYLNETGTNQKKWVLSLNFSEEIINTSWLKWNKDVSGNLYPIFGSIIQYLINKYGWEKMISFLKELKNSAKNQEKISIKVFKKSINDIQKDWIRWLKK